MDRGKIAALCVLVTAEPMRTLTLLLVISPFAFSQGQGPLMQSILPKFETAKLDIVETAELFGDGDYAFKLNAPQRSIGEWMQHNIMMNYSSCSQITNTPPMDTAKFRMVTSKAELLPVLQQSFDYCGAAFKSFSDDTALKSFQVQGRPAAIPATVMINLLTLWNEHYGNLVGYIRTKGLVPPSTARVQKSAKQVK